LAVCYYFLYSMLYMYMLYKCFYIILNEVDN